MKPIRLAAAAAALALGACSGSAAHPPETPSPTVQQREQVSLDYARCLRQHGAQVADPTFAPDGSPQWAVDLKTLPAAQAQPCEPILRRLGPVSGKPASGPSALPAMTRFAACMRRHGMPDFPDPNPDGTGFPTRSDPNLDPAFQPAMAACRSLLPPAR